MNIRISNNTLTVLKLIGITAMLIDHYNRFVKPVYSQELFEIGRLALPLFVFVLGYNLARIPADKMPKIMLRLLIFGAIATPVYNALGNGIWSWWPLNILFTLFVATATIYLLSAVPSSNRISTPTKHLIAILFFLITGSMVDYFWVGPGLVVFTWYLFKNSPKLFSFKGIVVYAVLTVLTALLCLLNKSLTALLALPIIILVAVLFQRDTLPLPRMKWFFYWFYPGHLIALFLIKNL